LGNAECSEQNVEIVFKEAFLDMDGIIATAYGECKQGMDMSYKGEWAYTQAGLKNPAPVIALVVCQA